MSKELPRDKRRGRDMSVRLVEVCDICEWNSSQYWDGGMGRHCMACISKMASNKFSMARSNWCPIGCLGIEEEKRIKRSVCDTCALGTDWEKCRFRMGPHTLCRCWIPREVLIAEDEEEI